MFLEVAQFHQFAHFRRLQIRQYFDKALLAKEVAVFFVIAFFLQILQVSFALFLSCQFKSTLVKNWTKTLSVSEVSWQFKDDQSLLLLYSALGDLHEWQDKKLIFACINISNRKPVTSAQNGPSSL